MGGHRYRAAEADERPWDRAQRPKRCRLATQPSLQRLVASKLLLDWSPEQIAGWLKREFPAQETMRISHETIYRSLFIRARRGAQERTDGPSPIPAQDAASAIRQHGEPAAWTNRGWGLYP